MEAMRLAARKDDEIDDFDYDDEHVDVNSEIEEYGTDVDDEDEDELDSTRGLDTPIPGGDEEDELEEPELIPPPVESHEPSWDVRPIRLGKPKRPR